MHRRNLHFLVSPGFLVGLCILLLNDFVLKQHFHNSFTGKLSDFAGLFVFSLFWTIFTPRYKFPIYLLTATLFIFWKSEHSQSLIEGWNSLQLFRVGRTVDYSDLIALIMLPISYAYSSLKAHVDSPHEALYGIAVIAVFAFTATSYSHDTYYDNRYRFQDSKVELIKKIKSLRTKYDRSAFLLESDSDKFDVYFDDCVGSASINVSEENGLGVIRLNKINFRCPSGGDKDEMLGYFEKEFIEILRDSKTNEPNQIIYIFPASPSNNSFNASGIRLDFIVNLAVPQLTPAALIRALGACL
jgi:hypothetical protein